MQPAVLALHVQPFEMCTFVVYSCLAIQHYDIPLISGSDIQYIFDVCHHYFLFEVCLILYHI